MGNNAGHDHQIPASELDLDIGSQEPDQVSLDYPDEGTTKGSLQEKQRSSSTFCPMFHTSSFTIQAPRVFRDTNVHLIYHAQLDTIIFYRFIPKTGKGASTLYLNLIDPTTPSTILSYQSSLTLRGSYQGTSLYAPMHSAIQFLSNLDVMAVGYSDEDTQVTTGVYRVLDSRKYLHLVTHYITTQPASTLVDRCLQVCLQQGGKLKNADVGLAPIAGRMSLFKRATHTAPALQLQRHWGPHRRMLGSVWK